jgi:hypothetical protein
MTKTRSVPFTELRQFLQRLGYKEKCSSNAWVFTALEKICWFFVGIQILIYSRNMTW